MELAPIVIFSYDRPDHLSKVLTALAKNDLADQSVLYIYCDGAKDTASEEQRNRIVRNREVARAATGFKELHVIERPKNIGLKDNIVGAVTEIVNQYGRIITLEDDIITSVGFLKYMNDALELYKDDDKVMHVSSYMFPHKWKLPETFFYEVPYPGGGWATWARAWQYYDDDTEKIYKEWCHRWDEFNHYGGTNLQDQLVRNLQGTLRTWFVKWHAALLSRGGLTLYPTWSLTTNIGFDSSGSNCFTTNKYYIYNLKDYVRVKRVPIRENRLAAHEIWAFRNGRWYSKRNRDKWIAKIKSLFRK